MTHNHALNNRKNKLQKNKLVSTFRGLIQDLALPDLQSRPQEFNSQVMVNRWLERKRTANPAVPNRTTIELQQPTMECTTEITLDLVS